MAVVPPSSPSPLRALPSVERVLQRLRRHSGMNEPVTSKERNAVRDVVRVVLNRYREKVIKSSSTVDDTTEKVMTEIEQDVIRLLQHRRTQGLRAVINATGVILHTNLGRAPLATEAVAALKEIAAHYSNLEYNLETGKRGHRDVHCEGLLRDLLSCESAIVVNNCASALLLILDAFCQGGEAIISRGELIEIGGGFRIPDIMRKSGVRLCEVGTTNRTRLTDYEEALSPHTRMILRVHPSNFRLVGFAERPTLSEVVSLAHRHNLLCCEDIGSGALVDLSCCGLSDEPLAAQSLAAGVDLVTFSGDKLLGGPQAGIIAGRREYIDILRRNPWMRALRVDKLVFAALEATLRLYATGEADQKIPALKALTMSAETVSRRTKRFLRRLRQALRKQGNDSEARLAAGYSLVGGGSAPHVHLPTTVIGLTHPTLSISTFESRLRALSCPVIARVEDNQLVLDLRTVAEDQETALLEALVSVCCSSSP